MASPHEQLWHKIHTAKIRRREATHYERLERRRKGLDIRHRKFLAVPAILSFVSNYEESAEFIDEIRTTVLTNQDNILLDFNRCIKITPETCVVLAAEIDRCLRIRKRSITGNYPTNNDVYATLEALGFFKLLSIKPSRGIFVNSDSLEVVGLVSGKGKKEQVTAGILSLFTSAPRFQENKNLLGANIFRALTEAMGNVIDHAYPVEDHNPYSLGRWWRAGFRHSDIITIVLYDQGIGIPQTLPTTWPDIWASLVAGKLTPDDGMLIKLATELNRTSID